MLFRSSGRGAARPRQFRQASQTVNLTRRGFLAGAAALQVRRAAGKGERLAASLRRYADPLTEREVWRLTDPAVPHHHPQNYQRFASRNNAFLLLARLIEGQRQAVRLDFSPPRLTQLTEGAGLAPYSLCLAPDDRSFFFLQNGRLKQTGLRTLREREIFQVEDGWRATGDLGISIDGRFAALIEMRAADHVAEGGAAERFRRQYERQPLCRIRVVETVTGKSWIAVEDKAWLTRPQLRPKRDQILYAHEGPWDQVEARIWLVNLDGKQKQSLRPRQAPEQLGNEYWTADGKLVAYVHYPDHTGRKAAVRALNPDTREDQVLAPCTQFWHLMGNADHSAIAGSSRSKAGPNLYVLFPLTQRESTIDRKSVV